MFSQYPGGPVKYRRKRKLTVKRTSGSRSIEPTVCTTPHHLAAVHHTHSPWALAFPTVRARIGRLTSCDLCEQCLDIAPPHQIQVLPMPSLLRQPLAGIPCHTLRKCAVHLEPTIPGLMCHLLRGLVWRLRRDGGQRLCGWRKLWWLGVRRWRIGLEVCCCDERLGSGHRGAHGWWRGSRGLEICCCRSGRRVGEAVGILENLWRSEVYRLVVMVMVGVVVVLIGSHGCHGHIVVHHVDV